MPFDALEFDEDMATIDLGYDFAFLLMDLDIRVSRAAANRVMNRYLARTGDWDMVRGLPVFLSMRAMIRAHVVARGGEAAAASAYLARARAYLEPGEASVVVAIGGLPGAGKSTVARALAPDLGLAPGAVVVRSDEIRKRLQGVAPEIRLPASAYRATRSRAVFEAIDAAVRCLAAAGHAVIADATFMHPAHRASVAAAAGQARFLGIWLDADLAVLEARVAARRDDASDADLAVLRRAAASGARAGAWWSVAAGPADDPAKAIRNRLDNES